MFFSASAESWRNDARLTHGGEVDDRPWNGSDAGNGIKRVARTYT
jgi:hypothetical protein